MSAVLEVRGDDLLVRSDADPLELEFARWHESRSDGIACELRIISLLNNERRLLHFGRLNMSSTIARESLVKKMATRYPEFSWPEFIEQAAYMAYDRYRQGDPSIVLATYDGPQSKVLLYPYLDVNMPTVLYAMGGSGKSYLAMAMALSVACDVPILGPQSKPSESGPVMYLDWEADPGVHRERLDAVLAGISGTGMGEQRADAERVRYRRMSGSLAEMADGVRREVADLKAIFTIVDSLGAAMGGEPESADLTIRTFNGLRAIGGTALLIDHLPKGKSADVRKPFGSVYKENLARSTWYVQTRQEPGAKNADLSLFNFKRNAGTYAPRGLGLHFFTEGDVVTRVDFAQRAAGKLRDRTEDKDHIELISVTLDDLGKATVKELADKTGLSEAAVRTVFSDDKKSAQRRFVELDAIHTGGAGQPSKVWGLLSDRENVG